MLKVVIWRGKKLVKNEDVPQRWRRDWKGKWGEEGRGGGAGSLAGARA